jgi:hypothetical protein
MASSSFYYPGIPMASPVQTGDSLWKLFEKGMVVCEGIDKPQCSKIEDVMPVGNKLCVSTFFWEFNVEKLIQKKKAFYIQATSSGTPIASLPIFPLEYHPDEDVKTKIITDRKRLESMTGHVEYRDHGGRSKRGWIGYTKFVDGMTDEDLLITSSFLPVTVTPDHKTFNHEFVRIDVNDVRLLDEDFLQEKLNSLSYTEGFKNTVKYYMFECRSGPGNFLGLK